MPMARKVYMVSKVVINLLMLPANWAVRNSRVSYAYILVGKLFLLFYYFNFNNSLCNKQG